MTSTQPILRAALFQASILLTVLTGLLTLVLAAVALYTTLHGRYHDELANPQLAELNAQLRKDVANTALSERIRQLDRDLRQEYFVRQRRMELAGPGLIVCGGLFLLWLNAALWCRRRLPRPTGPPGIDVLALGRLGRWAVAAFALLVLSGSVVLGIAFQPWAPPTKENGLSANVPPATDEEMARNWPRFLGPGGRGLAVGQGVPMDWDGPSGKGILWKTAIPLGGDGSPVVWDKKVFVTGGNKDRRAVYCFDAGTGRMLWEKSVENVPGSGALKEENPQAGFAPATVCTDGVRVYAVFPNMDLIALGLDGKEKWKKNVGPIDINYGYASSPMTVGDKLILQIDQAYESDDKSCLLALDSFTGKELWRVKRPGLGMSWASPILIDTPKGRQIVTAGKPFAVAHDPADGHELWRAHVLDGEVAPSPAFGAGLVFTANKGAALSAIRPDGGSDVTATHVAWKFQDEETPALPDIASPACDGKRVYLVESTGVVTCFEAATGRKLWQKEHPGEFKATPVIVGDTVVLMSAGGTIRFLAAADEYKLLGAAKLGEEAGGTPAVLNGRMYLRGVKHLYCIGGGK